MSPIDPIDRWLGAANFEPLVEEVLAGTDSTGGDDPWADAVENPPPLSAEQRSFVTTTSPAFGASLTATSLTGEAPFSSLTDQAVDQADDDVIDFDQADDDVIDFDD